MERKFVVLNSLRTGVIACVALSAFSALAQDSSVQLQQGIPASMLEAASQPTTPPDAPEGDPPSLSDVLGVADESNAMGAQMGLQMPVAEPQKTEEDILKEERGEAFRGAVDTLMPLKPSEIRRILELYDQTSQAVETPIYTDPEPESTFVQASLEPGAKPVLIKTAVGNVTTMSIVDVTGQPWPIQDMTWAGDFTVEQPEAGTHMVRITPNSHFAQGNISMRLLGLNPPVIFTLKTERKTVHVRLDVQIPEVGPKGVLPPVVTPVSIKAGDDALTKVLIGTPSSAGMTKMSVEGVDGRTSAYVKDGLMYVRTPYTLLSPAWSKSVQSADGMHVYALESTPVILLSDKGKMVRAYLSSTELTNGQ
ncbi:MAG: DotH/IcmK family type IV secretion protein [Pseudobdellovibrionaceae bacterium]|jgi:intracellular multiplication protein IcmK|nr:DotH/IcmK family type IV secretion protein [Pseudobdellovibrionaceae bacterium]